MIKYSPSQLGYLQLCPRFQQDTRRDSSAAEEGNLLHEALTAKTLPEGLTPRQKTGIEICRGYLANLRVQYPTAEFQQEVKFKIPLPTWGRSHTWERELSARLDLLINVDKTLTQVTDWKFGEGEVVPAEENLQTIAYAYLVFQLFNPKRVRTTLVCPFNPVSVISEKLWEQQDISSLLSKIEMVVDRMEDPMQPPVLNWTTCRYCGNKYKCPALAEVVYKTRDTFSPDSAALVLRPDQALDPEIRGKRQRLAGILEDLSKQIRRDNLEAALERKEKIQGYQLVRRSGSAEIQDTARAFDALIKAGYPEDMLYGISSIRVSPLIKEIAKREKGDEKDVRTKIKTLLQDNFQEGDPVYYLKQEKRKEESE